MTRRIYVIYTGGTFGMKPTANGLEPDKGLKAKLTKLLPPAGINAMPEWDLHEYTHLIDSAMAQPLDWYGIAADIAAHYAQYDGFVVIHGTDTMAYTASSLSFALQGIRKPVLVTGSQLPLGEDNSDAYDNIVGALYVAANYALNEVCVYFDGKLLRGNRCTKLSSVSFHAFESPNYPILGEIINSEFQLDTNATLAQPAKENFAIVDPNPPEVMVIRLHPGFTTLQLQHILELPVSGVILQTFGSGNGPIQLPGFLDTLASARDRGVVMLNLSQCIHGSVEQGRYAAGAAFNQVGVMGGYDMTVEAAVAKLYHLFALKLPPEQIRQKLQQNLCGECTLS